MLNVLKRRLTDREIAKKLYFFWFTASFLFILFFGIIPILGNLKEKIEIRNQMVDLNEVLTQNIKKLSQLEKDYERAERYLPYLSEYLPQDADVQNYLVDFTSALSRTGFSLNKFTVSESDHLLIKVSLQGSGDEQRVIDEIENLKRVTNIEDISVSYQKDGSKNLSLSLKVFRFN